MVTSRTVRNLLVALPLLLALAVPIAQAATPDDQTTRPSMEWNGSDDFQFANRTFSSGSRLFYAGPQWFVNALPGSRRASSRYLDRAGDVVESTTRYNDYVGTLRDVFDVNLFSNISFGGSRRGPSKIHSVTLADANTPYYYTGAGTANWGTNGTWGSVDAVPGTGFPNGPGDSALNLQSVNGHVMQNVSGGVTVGTINHNPTSPANASPGVTWQITTSNPITMNQDGVGVGSAHISNSQILEINSLTIDGPGGLILGDNLIITNANPNGGFINIATGISGPAGNSVTVTGAGLVRFTTATTFLGQTLITAGNLEAAATNSLGGTPVITVNSGGTLLLSGNTTDRINNLATLELSGGTLSMNGVSEGGAGTTGVGALSLLANSTIDFASGITNSVIQFGAVGPHTVGMILSITNWDGTAGSGGGPERLLFAGDPSAFSDQYSQTDVLFNNTLGYTLVDFGDYDEVTAVPEPATWIGGVFVFASIVVRQLRKRSRTAARPLAS